MDVELKVSPALNDEIAFQIGRVIKLKAMQKVPFDTGWLSAHIKNRVEDGMIVVYTEGVPYADKMEFGCGPMQLSPAEKESVREWARAGRSGRPRMNKGGQEGVIRKLEEKGIEAGTPEAPFLTPNGRTRPFLRPAFFNLTSEDIKHALNEGLSGYNKI